MSTLLTISERIAMLTADIERLNSQMDTLQKDSLKVDAGEAEYMESEISDMMDLASKKGRKIKKLQKKLEKESKTSNTTLVVGEYEVDCRSDDGITIGLIDGMIAMARILCIRNLTSEAVKGALLDFQHDEDIAKLIGR